MQEGDEVSFTDMDGNVFLYEVALVETLMPAAIEEMESGGWALTMFNCFDQVEREKLLSRSFFDARGHGANLDIPQKIRFPRAHTRQAGLKLPDRFLQCSDRHRSSLHAWIDTPP